MAVAVSCSLIDVKPFRSEKRIVATRRSAWSMSSCDVSISRATTRGSRYFPKVSLIRSLVRSSPAMWLKASASWPISSLLVTGTLAARSPASMALAPSTRRRRARTRLFAPAALRPRPTTSATAKRTRLRRRMRCSCA